MGDESDGREPEGPRLIYLVKQLEAVIRALLDAVLRARRITVTQYTALTVLEQHPEQSAAQLARHSFVSAQAMDGVVRALEASGLIERHRDPDNRRRLVISLTPAARSLLAEIRPDVARIETAAFGSLGPQDRATLAHWLGEGRYGLERFRRGT
ncbi:MarR family transcriptional regulator [Microbacter sp. GSS18]|nr:MarR family transcriptional regulator [Microbacter sp. GSS18]